MPAHATYDTPKPARDRALAYLDALKWDGQPRLESIPRIGGFAAGPATDLALAVWLLVAVRRVREPGYPLPAVPVIVSASGTGKSGLVRALAGDLYASVPFTYSLDERDIAAHLATHAWIADVGVELGKRRGHVAAHLADWLARPADTYRLPYQASAVTALRSWTPIFTTDDPAFLDLASDARRFLPIAVAHPIDVPAVAAVRDQLWAEAVSFNGEPRFW